MEVGMWSTELRDWRKSNKLLQKEAAGYLSVPLPTYIGWETMDATPPKFVRIALKTIMRNFTVKPS